MWQQLLVVGLGGFVGAVARYGLSWLAQRQAETFPLGTLFVNVLGCLVIGGLMEVAEERTISPQTRLFLAVGLLGSFTTFSTLGYETFALLRDREFILATLSVAANVLIGLAAVVTGRALARAAIGVS